MWSPTDVGHLAKFGFVTDWDGAGGRREPGWQAVSRGYRFVARDDDPEAMAAARQLDRERFARAVDTVLHWLETDETLLPRQWRQESGPANTRVRVAVDGLRAIQTALEDALTPYVLRGEDEVPADTRGVRLLRFLLPEAARAARHDLSPGTRAQGSPKPCGQQGLPYVLGR